MKLFQKNKPVHLHPSERMRRQRTREQQGGVDNETASLDAHFNSFPDPTNAFDLLSSDWQHFRLERNEGSVRLVEERTRDRFVAFCDQAMGGLSGKSVLELGPYEGYHSYALVQHGAREVLAIEANPRNFLKCLIVKNHYGLSPVTYRLGDFSRYLATETKSFDFIFAAGVLYHLEEPFRCLDLIMQRSQSVGICTTYYDAQQKGFNFSGETRQVKYPGTEPFVLHKRSNPKGTKGRKHGIGKCAWMFSREDLLRFLAHRKFQVQIRDFVNPASEGPRIQLFARRCH